MDNPKLTSENVFRMARITHDQLIASLQNGLAPEAELCALVNGLVMRATELRAIENHHEVHKAQHAFDGPITPQSH